MLDSSIQAVKCYIIASLLHLYAKDDIRKVMVTGTPGVGKSIFILFLLNLAKERKRNVVLQIGDKVCAFISTPERITMASVDKESKDCFTAFSSRMKPSFFFYPGSKREGPKENVRVFTVVFASAHGKNLGSLRKSHRVVYHMPVWSLDELKECKDLCYPTASIDVEGLQVSMLRVCIRSGVGQLVACLV